MKVSVSAITRSLKILKAYYLISIKKILSGNGTYSQRIIYVHTNFHKETDVPACISILVSGASHKNIKEKYKYYAGHTISLGFENRVSLY